MIRDMGRIQLELSELMKNGVIKPVDVVEFAKSPDTALHQCFTWDDGEAAHQWRLEQARSVLRCYVITDQAEVAPYRAFVALRSDRKDGGGYRITTDVFTDKEMHAQLMRDALTDLRTARRRYATLKELSEVFKAIDSVDTEFQQQQSEAA